MDKPSLPILHYTNIRFTDDFKRMLTLDLDLLVKTPTFSEYKHRSLFQIYVRVPDDLLQNQRCYVFFEPQINLNASIRFGCAALKLQVTVVKAVKIIHHNNWCDFKEVTNEWLLADVLSYIKACPFWTNKLHKLLCDQTQLDFSQPSNQ
jgi:hypothetical protein